MLDEADERLVDKLRGLERVPVALASQRADGDAVECRRRRVRGRRTRRVSPVAPLPGGA